LLVFLRSRRSGISSADGTGTPWRNRRWRHCYPWNSV